MDGFAEKQGVSQHTPEDRESRNRRGTARLRTRFESLYSAGDYEGAGVLADISYAGALIENVSTKPELGKQLRIYVFVQPVCPVELVGWVVRHTEVGFAIAYTDLSDEIRRLVDDVSALVQVPQRSS